MKKKDINAKIINSAFWSFLLTLVNRIGALVFTLIVTRYLLPEKFGVYSIALSISTVILAFADLGINQTMIRYVSADIETNSKRAASYFRYLLKIKIYISLLSSVILACLSYPLAKSIYQNMELIPIFLLFSIYIFIFAMMGFFESIFYINKQVKYLAIKELILQETRIISVIFIFLSIAFVYYINGVVISLIFSGIISILFIFIIIKKKNLFLFKKSEEEIDKKKIMSFISFITIAGVASIIFANTDAIILGLLLPTEFVGYYKAALGLAAGIAGIISFTNFLLPIFTQINKKQIIKISNKILNFSFILSIPASFGLLALAKYIVRFIYGYEYLPAATVLYILVFIIPPFACSNFFYMLSSAREGPKYFAKSTLALAIYNLILNILFVLLIRDYSLLFATMGAAIATVISSYIYFFDLFALAKKDLKIPINSGLFIKPLFASIIMFLVLISINKTISDMTLIKGIIEMLLGTIIYFVVLIMIKGIEKRDFLIIKSVTVSNKRIKR